METGKARRLHIQRLGVAVHENLSEDGIDSDLLGLAIGVLCPFVWLKLDCDSWFTWLYLIVYQGNPFFFSQKEPYGLKPSNDGSR